MIELKPCPFCGYPDQSAELFNMPFKGHGWIGCPACGLYMQWKNDPAAAIKRWNRRVKNA